MNIQLQKVPVQKARCLNKTVNWKHGNMNTPYNVLKDITSSFINCTNQNNSKQNNIISSLKKLQKSNLIFNIKFYIDFKTNWNKIERKEIDTEFEYVTNHVSILLKKIKALKAQNNKYAKAKNNHNKQK